MHFWRVENLIDRLCIGLALIGGLGLIFATILTCVSIIMKLTRRLVDKLYEPGAFEWIHPILGEEELVQLGVGFTLFAVLPYVMLSRGHITIDLFSPVFGKVGNRILNLLGDVVLAALAYLLMSRQWFLIFKKARRDDPLWSELFIRGDWDVIGNRLRDSQESQIIGYPLWPTYIVAEFFTAMFFIVAVFCVIRALRDLIQPSETKA